MTPEKMERVGEVLEKALSLETAQRQQWLEETCAGDPELRSEVESLLASFEQAGSQFLNPEKGRGRENLSRRPVLAGRKIGAYDILEEIGRGGMGQVFAAARADGQYEKKVAIKLVRGGYDSEFIWERFRHERQILASLDHPNIARLVDGGTTDEGLPYLVMELVEGVPIDSYCDAHKLPVTERLRLFQQVCSAVQYAHQHLVIHRDLKPSNIFVTQEGSPKLLDFGIAKILDASGAAEVTQLRPFTLEYASPEQVCGERVTTATDVYSLGVVLYHLLTGRSPYRVDTRTPAKLAEAITLHEPERPSASVQRVETVPEGGQTRELTAETVSGTRESSPLRLQRRLRGDLDFILLKALRKEPDKRYGSVEQLSEDIRRHLEGVPVMARKGTWSYRAEKFVRRNRVAVAAAALVLITLLAGVMVTLREARIAEANRRRAEARFNDVRKLANSLIFEVNDSIIKVPGATQPRKLILQRALEYLDSLSKEAGNDPDLQRELATAYDRIASLQGNPRDPNLGDQTAALASYQKCIALRESLAGSNPRNSKDQVDLAAAYIAYSDFQSQAAGNPRVGFEYIRKAVAILDRERAASPNDFQIVDQSISAYTSLGLLQVGDGLTGTVGTVSEGTAALQKALLINQRGIQLSPASVRMHGMDAVINILLGDAELKLGNRPAAQNYYYRSQNILNSLNTSRGNVGIARISVVSMWRIADVLMIEGRTFEAIAWFRKAEQRDRQLAAVDRHNEELQSGLMASSAQLGHALVEGGRTEAGLRFLREALAMAEALPGQTPLIRTYEAQCHMWMGETAERKGNLREAAQEYAKGKAILAAMRSAGINDLRMQVFFSNATDRLAAALVKLGKPAEARKEYEQSLALLEPLALANPDNMEVLYALAETYTGEGDVAARIAKGNGNAATRPAKWMAARTWYDKSQNTWEKVSNPARISTSLMEVTVPREVSRRLAECDAQIASLTSPFSSTSPAKQ